MSQLSGYEEAEQKKNGGFLALNKETGELALYCPDELDKPNIRQRIKTIKDSLTKILSLEGKTYEWKDKTKPGKQYGLIAQDVEKIIPELVEQGETKYLNYTGIIPILIEAIKNKQKQIDELKSKIK